jgi:hypothetical protein
MLPSRPPAPQYHRRRRRTPAGDGIRAFVHAPLLGVDVPTQQQAEVWVSSSATQVNTGPPYRAESSTACSSSMKEHSLITSTLGRQTLLVHLV